MKLIDLNEKVEAALAEVGSKEIFDVNSYYNLQFSYDLNNSPNHPIDYENVYNGVNVGNQSHTKVEVSVFSIKDLLVQGNKCATIGTRPIFHVMSKKADCVFQETYLKIRVVVSHLLAVNPVEFEGADDSKVTCDPAATKKLYEVSADEMKTEVYDKVDMPKETFHANYEFEMLSGCTR